jgi:hypothetical protein
MHAQTASAARYRSVNDLHPAALDRLSENVSPDRSGNDIAIDPNNTSGGLPIEAA